ncbi:Hypothetical predicted protein [Podarcis lilfordi]|uniref:Uncharacterized protein n=1 Tax=Podarcis lilfordi TaxID=74358 RepID=A0AA35L3B4_9SAUR|nr:Hypothetical predicted protein [Podarcis lilfordi]
MEDSAPLNISATNSAASIRKSGNCQWGKKTTIVGVSSLHIRQYPRLPNELRKATRRAYNTIPSPPNSNTKSDVQFGILKIPNEPSKIARRGCQLAKCRKKRSSVETRVGGKALPSQKLQVEVKWQSPKEDSWSSHYCKAEGKGGRREPQEAPGLRRRVALPPLYFKEPPQRSQRGKEEEEGEGEGKPSRPWRTKEVPRAAMARGGEPPFRATKTRAAATAQGAREWRERRANQGAEGAGANEAERAGRCSPRPIGSRPCSSLHTHTQPGSLIPELTRGLLRLLRLLPCSARALVAELQARPA